ncbi:MAG: anti-sigma factor [Ignavibacteriales bacterium]|nr:anti-sigma factor [Ignavibacteriales bacterium]MBI3788377.1 anti-sigma factor [Ignavibacteriales bacterium]
MKEEQRHTYLELCIPYILGRLNPGNKKQFEAHIRTGCKECTKELAELENSLALLPLALKQQAPPAGAKERLIAKAVSGKFELPRPEKSRAEKGRPERTAKPEISKRAEDAVVARMATAPKVQRSWYGYATTFAAILIIAALGLYTNDLIKTIGKQNAQIVALQDEVQRRGEVLKILQSQRIDMVLMNGLEVNPAGYGKIIWDPVKKTAIFQVANLPVVPQGKDYQLWIIKNKKPVSAGVFAVTSEKEGGSYFKVMSLEVNERKDFDAFAVTLEPKGGVPQPTGAMYLLGATAKN